MNTVVLWFAQGFGAGRIPLAPGTFGSLVGLLWFYILLRSGNFWIYLLGTLSGLALSVWVCGKAERILNQTDPGSIVLDEMAAMPLCFVVWQAAPSTLLGPWQREDWRVIALLFLLFRIMDIAKPWPIRHSQKLPDGWGVTIDDALAAIYVAALSAIPLLWNAVA
jgi:phosphatidylglycerophosphatase A